MNAHNFPRTATPGPAERFDMLAGRSAWVWADYVRAGGEWIDRESGGKVTGAARAHHARCWAEINCPASKRASAIRAALTPELENV